MKRSVEQGCEPEKSSRKPASHNDEVNPKVKPSRFSVLLSEALGKSIEELRFFKSKEFRAPLRKQVLTEFSSKQGYSWHSEISVDVDSKKGGVTAKVFLFSDIAAGDSTVATLLISIITEKSLLTKLKEGCEDSWVVVETEVMDKYAGRRLDFMQCAPHKVDEKSGRVNFYQNLLSCNEVAHTESDSIDFILKVTFITSQRQELYNDSDYEMISAT